ncbi:MAG: polyribonucleotide nucleotidyltransferase [Parcubacteria group bacterium]|nr:polyribonucleotide nucleotidyltransferase [Parcubacteria group bacterium]|tara:strand:- start:8115 stop:10289 length:2175 start_codon:yes stop_codon:yes gene_type:complete
MQKKEYSIEIGGKTLTAQFTDLADQANGSVILSYGNTAVMATAVMGGEREGQDWFPLSVEFEEKFYAAGAILGSRFQRREGRPSEEAVLSARVVDRTIRPLFDQTLRRDIQVIVTVLAIDEEDPDVLGVIAASLALSTSDIPWNGPVSAVRIGQVADDKAFIINPSYTQRTADVEVLDLLACGQDGNINMIEVGSKEVPEERLVEGMGAAVAVHNTLQEWQKSIVKEIGKEKQEIPTQKIHETVSSLFETEIKPKMSEYVFGEKGAYALKNEWMTLVKEQLPEEAANAAAYFEIQVDEFVHVEALENDRRQDGRKMDEIRELYAQAGGISGLIHGTGIFYRGGTHVLSALTLGGPDDAQLVDTIEFQDTKKRYMHHYNFPPFSVGETGRVGGFNRRMIGHGALAEKALLPVLPSKEDFPYTIRIVSETMASNGSSSQASVCGSTLALMDAGVPITRPVAGIAMGMMSDRNGNYKILTDIQGPEDHFGDMDFKVAGTTAGVTAVQMDVKVAGVPVPVLAEAFAQAKTARLQIMDKILEAIKEPRADINPRAPKIISLHINEDQIGLVIGPGGKTINGIKDQTGATEISIEDDGSVFITGQNGTAEEAAKMIEELTHEYVAGERFDGQVTRIMDFGAFVRIGAQTEGLVHISELAPFRINSVTDVVKEGERVPVIIKEIDDKKRINLSIKDVDPKFASNKGIVPPTSNERHASESKPKTNGKKRSE